MVWVACREYLSWADEVLFSGSWCGPSSSIDTMQQISPTGLTNAVSFLDSCFFAVLILRNSYKLLCDI